MTEQRNSQSSAENLLTQIFLSVLLTFRTEKFREAKFLWMAVVLQYHVPQVTLALPTLIV